jgi:LPS-assembly lipoprotein
VTESANMADLVLTSLEDHYYRTVVASTAAGQVRELRLRAVLRFRVTQPDGKVLIEDTELERSRDMSYTETAALAKEAEEAVLMREIRADMVQQVLRMIALVGRQGGG